MRLPCLLQQLPLALLALSVNVASAQETQEAFQSDISRLLNVVTRSIYHHRDVFLRELTSNAGDALEKTRLLGLRQPEILKPAPLLNISIIPNPQENTLVIRDSGIGMSEQELRRNLGTIARSGTSEFMEKLEAGDAGNLIGQFGLGFYSSFLVADKVSVASKSVDDPTQWIFETAADAGSFTIKPDPRGDTLGRGTEITLHLKPDALEYLDQTNLKNLIAKHSTFSTSSPIYLWAESEEPPIDPEEETEAAELDIPKTSSWVHINDQPPIWMRDAKTVSDEEYISFYRGHFKEEEPPLFWTHIKGDVGSTSFRALVYVPSSMPNDLFAQNYVDLNALRLYVRRVFITNDLGINFLPKWLQFVRIIIDADDLPLNVGRDSLQHNKALGQIQRNVIKKTLDMFAQYSESEDPEDVAKYERFYAIGGTALKLGAYEDERLREKLVKLLRWSSSQSSAVSLDDYIGRRRQGQTQIYFAALAGGRQEDLEQSPFVERIVARGYEVLWFLEPLDEMLAAGVRDWQGLVFQDVAKKGLKMDEDANEKAEEAEFKESFKPLIEYFKNELAEYTNEVTISTRLTTSPCAVITDDMAWTGNMERLMAAQTSAREQDTLMAQFFKSQKKVLEINPRHPLIEGLLESVEAGDDVKDTIWTLWDTSMVRSGFPLRDPTAYFNRVEKLLRRTVGVQETAQVDQSFIRPAPEVDDGPLPPPKQPEEWMDFTQFKEQAAERKKAEGVEHDEL